MAYEASNFIQAIAAVTPIAAGPAQAVVFNGSSPGFNQSFAAGSTHTVAGQYNLKLDDAIDETSEAAIFATPLSTSQDTNVTIEHVSGTVKRVRTSIAGVASDLVGFGVVVMRRPG